MHSRRFGQNFGRQSETKSNIDNCVNLDNIASVVQDENEKPLSLIDVGQKLVGHSKAAEFTANRGLVVELFPFIFEASERMSARAISRFLLDEQGIKLSAVTITKALNEPKKSWISFFESIELSATVIAKWIKPSSFKFLYLSKSDFENRTSPDKEGIVAGLIVRGAMAILKPNWVAARKLLLEKWFSIGMGTRTKAKPFLEEYLMTLEDKF